MGRTGVQEKASVTLRDVMSLLNAKAVGGGIDESTAVETAGAADLMSDVLAFVRVGALLLTGLTTPQVVYTAEMADIKIVCFVRGKKPSVETATLAKKKGIILIQTPLAMFESCGRLYASGVKGCAQR
jgi:hypothetical protein